MRTIPLSHTHTNNLSLSAFPISLFSKAIGQRNMVESETENRENKKMALQTQINEKLAELERCNKQYQSLVQLEAEQVSLIEKLSNNEI